MKFAIAALGFGFLRKDEFNPDRRQQTHKCWVGNELNGGVSENLRDAKLYDNEQDALAALWEIDNWYGTSDEPGEWFGHQYYWVERVEHGPVQEAA